MLTEKFYEVLKHEGVVSITSWGEGEPHVTNTWNSYLVIQKEDTILIPAAVIHCTENYVKQNDRVKVTLGSKEVLGFNNYQGTGFLIEGIASFEESGEEYTLMKEKFPFLSRVLKIKVTSLKQLL